MFQYHNAFDFQKHKCNYKYKCKYKRKCEHPSSPSLTSTSTFSYFTNIIKIDNISAFTLYACYDTLSVHRDYNWPLYIKIYIIYCSMTFHAPYIHWDCLAFNLSPNMRPGGRAVKSFMYFKNRALSACVIYSKEIGIFDTNES